MNGSSPNQLFSKSWQRPGNLAMMASVVAHGFLFAGLALVPATGQQTAKKQLRVVSLLQTPPNQPAQSNQPNDPNAPPPAPGVAGLPLNITTSDGLAELSVTETPNPAFDPFASSVVELPSPPSQASSTPSNSDLQAATSPPQPAASPDSAAQSQSKEGPALSDEDFEAWLRGENKLLPNLSPDPGATGPLNPPEVSPGPVANNSVPSQPANGEGIDPNSSNLDNPSAPAPPSIVPPRETVKRFLAYDYPQAACKDRLEGKAEYRIWVSSQASPVVSDIVLSTNSDILDRAVKVAAQKYKIQAEDANKLVVLPFDIKYSQKACEAKEKPSSPPSLEPDSSQSTPAPTSPTPKPQKPTGEKNDDDPKGKNSPSQPLSPNLPDGPQLEEPVVQPTQPPQPVAPQPSSPTVQPPAATTPTPDPVQPAVPLKAPPSNSDLPPSVSPADPPGSLNDIKSAPTRPPAAETTPPVVDDSETN